MLGPSNTSTRRIWRSEKAHEMLQTPAFRDPDAAARELVEIAGVEAVQDGRVYIERVNARRGAGQSPAHRKTRQRVGICRREVQSQTPRSDQ